MLGKTTSLSSGSFILIIFVFFFSENLFSQVSTVSAGSWLETTTWQGGVVPGNNDVDLKDVVIQNDSVVIPEGVILEINNLTIGGGGKLVVNGTLIVHQNVLMTNTSVGYSMGSSAAVIVYGNFEIKNQVKISLSSFLVVYGDFTKSGSSNQGDVEINEGNIYILGDVDGNGWPTDFGCTTDEYSGSTPTESANCDYGNEQDFEDNQDSFPDELVDYINCYDLSSISATHACPGGSSTLSINNLELTGVTFKWQINNNGIWEEIGSSDSVTVTNIQDFNKEYRVIVRPEDTSTACKLSISRNIKITQILGSIWTGAVDTNWSNTANWSCNSLPTLTTNVTIPGNLDNYPVINTGANALAKDLTIETDASVIVNDNWLRIAGDLANSGNLNTENGSVSFEGTSAQTIPSGAFSGNRILNLRINNTAGVTSQAVIEILNSLKVESGSFVTGNDLTLISNVSGTAFIDGNGGGEVIGTVKMQRHLSNGFGYKYFSSPFSNSTVDDFVPFMNLTEATTGFPHFYEYREGRKSGDTTDITGWEAYIQTGNKLNVAEGYALNISGITTPVNIEIGGAVNNGPVNISLENNNGTYTKGFNLVGNPYPSPINWSLMVPDLSGIDNAIYFFNAGSDDRYTGTYSSYVNGVYTNAITSIIPSMQGFFVRVSNPGTASLNFTNAARTDNQVKQDFYKSKNPRVIPQITLTAGFSGEKTSDVAVIYFNTGATAGFEKDLDAFKLLNTATEVPSLYSLTQNQEKLSINAISPAKTQEIPLGIKTEKTGKLFINLANVENIFPSVYIYLKDQKNKLVHDLSEENVYSFTSQKGENNDRFVLLLSSEKLSAAEIALATEDFTIYTQDKEIIVKLNLSTNGKGKVILANISGQVVQIQSSNGKREVRFSGNLTPGIYLVTLETGTESHTKKVIFKN